LNDLTEDVAKSITNNNALAKFHCPCGGKILQTPLSAFGLDIWLYHSAQCAILVDKA
jgi:hypothetical protein